jgi:hypothetical protein
MTFGSQLFYLLRILTDFECSYDADHVFGLLGLYQNALHLEDLPVLLRPDYGKALQDVLRDTTLSVIRECKDLRYFRRLDSQAGHLGDSELPSWVGLWHKSSNDSGLAHHIANFFHADANSALQLDHAWTKTDQDSLMLRGFVVEMVSTIAPVQFRHIARQTGREVAVVHELELFFQNANIDDISRGRTLIADENSRFQQATTEDHSDYQVWKEYILRTRHIPPKLRSLDATLHNDATKRAAHYQSALIRMCYNRSLFGTSGRHIGIGPRTMKNGDIVAILYGCQWPVILRDEGAHHRILGLSYLDGVMHGEAVAQHRANNGLDILFSVR